MTVEDREESMRAIIIEQATKLFKVFGYHKLIMEDIARAVGKGRSTLYLYFKDKEAIFQAIIEKETQDYFRILEAELTTRKSASEKITHYCHVKFDFALSKINEYLILNQEMLKQPAIMYKIRLISDPPEVRYLEEVIKEGIKQGEFAFLEPQQISLMASLLVSTMYGIVNDFLPKYQEYNMAELKEHVTIIFLKPLQKS